MSDLNVVAVLTANPGAESVLEAALTNLATSSLTEEGCQSYELFRSAADSGTFITIERWGSQADLDAHMEAPNVAEALRAAGDALAAPPAIHPLIPAG